MNNGQNSNTSEFIYLEDIIGIHEHVAKLNLKFPMTSYQNFSASDFPPEVILSILKLKPIVVRKTGSKYYCVGNTRLYEIASLALTPLTKVPVSFLSNRNLSEIEKLFWSERLLLPVIYDIGSKRTTRLTELWNYFRYENIWKEKPLKSITTKTKFLKLLRDYRN